MNKKFINKKFINKIEKISTKHSEIKNKKYMLADRILFVVLVLFVSVITYILFYRQTSTVTELFHSDMKAYILEMQGLDSGYSFPYPIFFKFSALLNVFFTPEVAVAMATMLLNSFAIVLTKFMLQDILQHKIKKEFQSNTWMVGPIISIVAVSLFFVSMIYLPEGIYFPGIKNNYLGVFTSNPFHNATYMAARPFTILALWWYVKLLDKYENISLQKGENTISQWKDHILFSLFLLLATMTKPSFTIVLVGVAGLIMVYRMIKTKFQNFMPTIWLGICFIPTFIDLFYQFGGVFVPAEGDVGGLGFTFGGVWKLYCDNIPLAICLAIGFPLTVLLFHYKEIKDNTFYRFTWQIYIMSFVMAFILREKGFREVHFNFSWGYMYGIFFAFVGAVHILLLSTFKAINENNGKRNWKIGIQWMAFGAHIVCGIFYFYHIFQGAMYY